jgi:hypothetical protein
MVLALAVLVLALGGGAIWLLTKYQQGRKPAGDSAAVAVPGMLRAPDTNFEYYKNKIRLENVQAGLGITFSEKRVALISGIIANDGDRKLEALELRVSLYDVYGKLSKQRIATPLRPGVGLHGPMKPTERRSFSVGVDSVEQLWNPKKVEIEITGLKYQ